MGFADLWDVSGMATMRKSTADWDTDPSLIKGSWTFHVTVRFDAEEGVFVATSDERPYLTARADTEESAVDAVGEMLVEHLARSAAT